MPLTVREEFTTQNVDTNCRVDLITINWTSDSTGAVSAVLARASGTQIKFAHTLLQVAFKPGTTPNQPTDLYDVTLTNAAGVDVLGGLGANLSNANAKQETPITSNGFPFVLAGPLTLNVTNAGNAKSGSIFFFVR